MSMLDHAEYGFLKNRWDQVRVATARTTGLILGMKTAGKTLGDVMKQSMAAHKLLRFRHRYFFTRSNTLRFRYITAGVLAGVVSLSVFLGTSTESMALKVSGDVLAPVSQEHAAIQPEYPDVASSGVSRILQSHVSEGIRKASMALKKPERILHEEITIKSGQTVGGRLQNAGLTGGEAYRAVEALSKHFDVRTVKAGQKISLHYEPKGAEGRSLSKINVALSPVKEIHVKRGAEGGFQAELIEKELIKRTYGGEASIQTSVFGSAARANIPPAIIAEMIRIYSWDVDFQRDIRKGDHIKIMYEAYETEDGQFGKYGNILFASLTLSGTEIPIYRFEMDNGNVDFFQPDGRSIRKTLMKTPIDGARVSSGYGMRMHPVLGYNKMHKGMDFAAPTGTPIYAAGDGVVEHVGRRGAYGKYIRIRHNSKLKTAYAHLHKYKKGLAAGKRVKQGDVIGYVGSTGRSTGPHLHYEVISNGKQVNPRSLDLPTGEELEGKDMKRFKSMVGDVKDQYVSLTRGTNFASNTTTQIR